MGWEGPVTHRQLLVWGEYFRAEMDRPSRTDFYLMRVAFEAFYSQRKYPNEIDLEPFRLKFSSKEPTADAKKSPGWLDKDTATVMFKAQFTAALGLTEFDVQESDANSGEEPELDLENP
jgi:hypothetical protein